MTKHDQRRIDALKKTLLKAKEQVETVTLYLDGNNLEKLMDINLVGEHIEIALERLGEGGNNDERASDCEAAG